ncbi:MAG: deoxyribonuclease IV [Thermodesulfobacteriota bacterium]
MRKAGKTQKHTPRTPLGVHTSIAGGRHLSVDRAVELGCTAMQIFGRNPRSWGFTPVPDADAALFRRKRQEASIGPVAVHTTYLINLSSPDDALFKKSVGLFKGELGIADALGADYLVTHLGSPGSMGVEFAVGRVVSALKETVLSTPGARTRILLENTSGAGSGFGGDIAVIGRILALAQKEGIEAGLCFDTCHAFAAGYPMRSAEEVASLVSRLDAEAGPGRVRLIHLNDSKGEAGSKLDRHEQIGMGRIGTEAFSLLLNHPSIRGIPLILETPKKAPGDDARNIDAVRDILKGDI